MATSLRYLLFRHWIFAGLDTVLAATPRSTPMAATSRDATR